jgi:hypothetical protein
VQAEAAAAADLLFMWRQHLLGKMLTAKQYNLGLERYRCVPWRVPARLQLLLA